MDTQHRGVPIPEEYTSAPSSPQTVAWRQGVNDALKALGIGGLMTVPLPAETRSVQYMSDDRPDDAQELVNQMTGRDRAVFGYLVRELDYMIQTADNRERNNRIHGDHG